ncbi:MAG TPA: hypothetical protein VG826_20780 [Pirellulales bacterium]|nr:hypothetical protein [Pirellulales bacterium]
MSANSPDFRQQLLETQDMSPALRDACRKEIAALSQHTLTPRTSGLLVLLLLATLLFAAVGLRAMLFHYRGPLLYGVWTTFTLASAAGAVWIGVSLWQGRFQWKSYFPVADAFTVAAAVISVLTLLMGARAPADPASSFATLYALTFLVICVAWSIHSRIAAAELAAREHSLRIECRLADLAGRMQRPSI